VIVVFVPTDYRFQIFVCRKRAFTMTGQKSKRIMTKSVEVLRTRVSRRNDGKFDMLFLTERVGVPFGGQWSSIPRVECYFFALTRVKFKMRLRLLEIRKNRRRRRPIGILSYQNRNVGHRTRGCDVIVVVQRVGCVPWVGSSRVSSRLRIAFAKELYRCGGYIVASVQDWNNSKIFRIELGTYVISICKITTISIL
jgi:hypothetical protein